MTPRGNLIREGCPRHYLFAFHISLVSRAGAPHDMAKAKSAAKKPVAKKPAAKAAAKKPAAKKK
jgi:hypothetical protein